MCTKIPMYWVMLWNQPRPESSKFENFLFIELRLKLTSLNVPAALIILLDQNKLFAKIWSILNWFYIFINFELWLILVNCSILRYFIYAKFICSTEYDSVEFFHHKSNIIAIELQYRSSLYSRFPGVSQELGSKGLQIHFINLSMLQVYIIITRSPILREITVKRFHWISTQCSSPYAKSSTSALFISVSNSKTSSKARDLLMAESKNLLLSPSSAENRKTIDQFSII